MFKRIKETFITPVRKLTSTFINQIQSFRQDVQVQRQESIDETQGSVVPTSKERAGELFPVSRRDIVSPVVEMAQRPQVQRATITRGSLFEPSDTSTVPDLVEDTAVAKFNPRPDYVESIPPGMSCTCSGTYYSGGAGTWNYNVPSSVLPVWVGRVCIAPVAPYGGTRGTHMRRFVIDSISIGQGSSAYKDLVG